MRIVLVATLALVSMICGTSASAHHSRAVYDLTRFITVEGTVEEWKWTNPHTALIVRVKTTDGKETVWNFEGGSPSFLSRYGWKRLDLKFGDKVTVLARPMRDGSNGGSFSQIQIEGGKQLKGPDNANAQRKRAEDDDLEGPK